MADRRAGPDQVDGGLERLRFEVDLALRMAERLVAAGELGAAVRLIDEARLTCTQAFERLTGARAAWLRRRAFVMSGVAAAVATALSAAALVGSGPQDRHPAQASPRAVVSPPGSRPARPAAGQAPAPLRLPATVQATGAPLPQAADSPDAAAPPPSPDIIQQANDLIRQPPPILPPASLPLVTTPTPGVSGDPRATP